MDNSGMSAAARIVAALRPGEEPDFVSNHIAEKSLHGLICELNADILSKEPGRVQAATEALRRIGFV